MDGVAGVAVAAGVGIDAGVETGEEGAVEAGAKRGSADGSVDREAALVASILAKLARSVFAASVRYGVGVAGVARATVAGVQEEAAVVADGGVVTKAPNSVERRYADDRGAGGATPAAPFQVGRGVGREAGGAGMAGKLNEVPVGAGFCAKSGWPPKTNPPNPAVGGPIPAGQRGASKSSLNARVSCDPVPTSS